MLTAFAHQGLWVGGGHRARASVPFKAFLHALVLAGFPLAAMADTGHRQDERDRLVDGYVKLCISCEKRVILDIRDPLPEEETGVIVFGEGGGLMPGGTRRGPR